ncbi:DUF4365 domain-containing protein [Streptoalloteichus hindustanus]|uniref:DUF4365 domain-containing protein n=1 Tax=Streptoalloteichus hindustanus TaxID=2017 RepID=A0A1M5CHX3_STRHI|nr:DUF4365 domain-containing protein [Streptoalloteichus hindustanus]SHF54375.1 protein of unknown function [Streptoalloteichus hindustanus]
MSGVNGNGSLRTEPVAEAPDGGLPITARQEQFSLAFVRMVAAAAGCSIKSHETDYDGVDITVVSSAEYEKYYCPEFEIQLKCTTQHHLLKDDHLAWSLERDRFLKLVNPKRFTPALLGVLLIPEDPHQLLDLSEEGMTSSSRMYWEHATNLGRIEDGKASRTVRLPRINLFDVRGLQSLMHRIGEGGQW